MPEKINSADKSNPVAGNTTNDGNDLNKNSSRSDWNDNSRIDWHDNGANWGKDKQDPSAEDALPQERGKDRTGYDNGSNVSGDSD